MASEFVVVTGNALDSNPRLAFDAVELVYGFPEEFARIQRSEEWSKEELFSDRLALFADSPRPTVISASCDLLPIVARFATEIVIVSDKTVPYGIANSFRQHHLNRVIGRVMQGNPRLVRPPLEIMVSSKLQRSLAK